VSGRRWDELEKLLAAALDRPAPDRTAFLDRACAGRPELRQELAELIAAHGRDSVLDAPAIALLEPAPPAPVRAVRETVGHYRILECLGRGGMGVVYKARDLRLERTLALKFLPAHLSFEETAKERLRAEAQAAAALDHLNICTIHEIGEAEDGQLFIAMPFYQGETLEARLGRGPVPPEEALALALQAARGLSRAHERGVIHRDVKPANLMITSDGVLKILDFGIAKVPGVQLTPPGQRPGTVAYMSPEQVRGEPIDGRTDVWSLGVVLHELLTGERRFQGSDQVALLRAILEFHPEPVRARHPALPEELDRVLARMLAKHPADRYAAAELAHDLEQLARSLPAEAGSPEVLPGGERRRLTILVVAMAGVERFRATVEDVLRRHGGVINAFDGESVQALFGAPATHEDDPMRAVRAAIELHRRVLELGGETSEELRGPPPRSGIHSGSFAVRPSTETGPIYRIEEHAVPVATRLSSRAPPGEIWVTAECCRAIAGLFDTEALPAVEPEDHGPSVIPFRVLVESEPRTRLEAAQRVGLTAFSGRGRELAALERALREAVAGEGRFLTITGDAGMGKSRLLLELKRLLEPTPVGLLQGRCDPSESGTTYLPFVEMLRNWLGAARGERITLGVAEVAARLRALGPEVEEFLPLYLHLLVLPSPEYPVPRHLHGEHYRLVMQEALAAFVTLAARRQPTALLLEDWQWADEASHGVLQQVAELVTGIPLLVVVTSRPSPRGWGQPAHHLVVSLEPLDTEASGSMLRSILGAARVPADLVGLIHRRTGGNPFFLEEITQGLLEEGALGLEDGAVMPTGALDRLQLPDTVQAVIRARLDRLDRGTREVLRIASVIGPEFTRGILERAMEGGRLPHALQTLKAAGVIQQVRVVPEPAYRFKHALTQETAAGSLLEHQRKELHGRVGEAIESQYRGELDEHLGRLVEHFSRAECWPKAVRYARRAAERAGALSQFAESLEILERAQSWLLRLPDDAERRDALVDILFRQERLCETLGLRGRQQRIIDELVALLERTGDPARLAEAYVRLGDLSTLLRRFPDAEAALDRALRLRADLGDAVGRGNVLGSLGLLRWHQGRDEDALGCMEAALAIDRERGDLECQVRDLTNLGNVLKGMGRYDQARLTLEEGLLLNDRLASGREGIPETDPSYKRTYILHCIANVHRELGDDAKALEYLAQARTLTTEKRLPIQLSYHLTSTAHIYLQHGNVEECLRLYREAVELTRKAKFAHGLAQALRFLGEVLFGLGRHEEALPPLIEAAGLFAQLRDPVTEALLWTEVARLRERRGELEAALGAWGKARALHDRDGDEARGLEVLEGLARVVRRLLPEPSLALGYYGEALAVAERLDDRPAVGRLRNAMGIVEWERGRYDEARAQYEAGLQIFRQLDDPGNAAIMLASLGVTLSAMGRWVEARRCLEEARALHRSAGDGQAEARALGALADVLRRLGEAERAIECGEESLRLRRQYGDRVGEGWMLQRLALAHAATGAAARASECSAAAERIAVETEDEELGAACREIPRALGLA
jgi:tetratricopeptide (TPR) repeat protein/class 3 adenylate cyclase